MVINSFFLVMTTLMKQVPLGRKGTPDELAQAVEFLLSDKSSYITGTILQVSGGFAA